MTLNTLNNHSFARVLNHLGSSNASRVSLATRRHHNHALLQARLGARDAAVHAKAALDAQARRLAGALYRIIARYRKNPNQHKYEIVSFNKKYREIGYPGYTLSRGRLPVVANRIYVNVSWRSVSSNVNTNVEGEEQGFVLGLSIVRHQNGSFMLRSTPSSRNFRHANGVPRSALVFAEAAVNAALKMYNQHPVQQW